MSVTWFWIGIGGFFGTVARYKIGQLFVSNSSTNLPLGTITVNLVGSFLMGLIIGIMMKKGTPLVNPSGHSWNDPLNHGVVVLTTGFLGGFTTFSAFSAETLSLFQTGHVELAIGTSALQILGGVGGALVGIALGQLVSRYLGAF